MYDLRNAIGIADVRPFKMPNLKSRSRACTLCKMQKIQYAKCTMQIHNANHIKRPNRCKKIRSTEGKSESIRNNCHRHKANNKYTKRKGDRHSKKRTSMNANVRTPKCDRDCRGPNFQDALAQNSRARTRCQMQKVQLAKCTMPMHNVKNECCIQHVCCFWG